MSMQTAKSGKKRRDYNSISLPANLIWNGIFILCCLTCIIPILLVVIVSFTDEITLLRNGYSFFPELLSTSAYEYIFKKGGAVINAYGITLLVTIVGTVCSTLTIALYAYPLSRSNFAYKKFFTTFAFITMLFSGGLVPWYIIYTQVIGIGNTLAILIIPYLMNTWYMMIMRTFYKSTIPEELLESARIDGAGEIRTFFSIVLPLSTAGIATVALFSMLAYWNDWYLPLIFIRDDKLYNIQYLMKAMLENAQFLARMSSQVAGASISVKDLPSETMRMAIAVVAIGPIVLAYPFFQRYFVKGLTIGAVKG